MFTLSWNNSSVGNDLIFQLVELYTGVAFLLVLYSYRFIQLPILTIVLGELVNLELKRIIEHHSTLEWILILLVPMYSGYWDNRLLGHYQEKF